MADGFAIGKALEIPDSVLKNIEQIDKKINDISKDSELMAQHFGSAMIRMGNGSDTLLKKLQQIHGIISGLGNVNISGLNNVSSGMIKTASEAEKVANSVTKAANAIDKMNTADKITDPQKSVTAWQKISDKITELNKKQEELTRITARYEKTLANINSGKGGVLTKDMQDQYKAALKELEVNKALIASYMRKQQAIIAYQAEQKKQLQNAEALKNIASGGTLNEQRQADEIKKLNDYYKELEKSSAAAEKKRQEEAKKTANEVEKTAQKEAKAREQAAKAIERKAKAQAKLDSQLRKSNYQAYVTSTSGALRTADKADTYEKRAQAIKNLEAAIKKLRTTDANYQNDLKRLSEVHIRLSQQQKAVEANFKSIAKSQSNLMNTSDQLMRKLALIFSVSQIQGYLMNLVRVRGEFELQNTALASILQNKDKADKLFGQITELAVKSPFTLKELTTYTKSLSAYQIEYEKLYDTTKMLADVSAGLGVDMQRLILAFGQVKAANFLRGTEVRQFTEAGFNILGELAKYYSELEGNMVTVGDVQERVTKRMVEFGAVEEVFKRVTSAGGIFYNMQEKQAETIAGQMSNLQDSIDIMLNDIGKANDGVIRNMIVAIKTVIQNWEVFANILNASVAGFVIYTAKTILAAKANGAFAASTTAVATAQKGLAGVLLTTTKAFRSFLAFAKSNPFILIATAAVYAYNELSSHIDKVEAARKEYDRLSNSIITTKRELSDIIQKVSDNNTAIQQYNDKLRNLSEGSEEYKKNQEGLNKAQDEQKRILNELKSKFPEVYDGLVKQKDGTVDLTEAQKQYNEELEKTRALNILMQQGVTFFGDDIKTDFKQLNESYEANKKATEGIATALQVVDIEATKAANSANKLDRQYGIAVQNILKSSKTAEEKLKDVRTLLEMSATSGGVSRTIYNIAADAIIELNKANRDLTSDTKEAERELQKIIENVLASTKVATAEQFRALDEESKKSAVKFAQQFIEEIPSIKNEFIQQFVNEKFQATLGVTFDFKGKEEAVFSAVEKQIKDYLEKNKLTLVPEIKAGKGENAYFDNLRAKYKEVTAEIETLNKATEERSGEETNKERLQDLEAERKQIKQVLLAYGELNEAKSKKKGENEELKRLKEQIALIKKAGEEYKKLRQYYNEADATKQIRESFEDAFSNLGLDISMSFDPSGVIQGIESLTYNTIKGGKKAIDEALAPLKSEQEIKVKASGIEEIQRQVENIFSNYEFNLELKAAGIDTDAFKNMLQDLGATDQEISMVGLDAATFEEAAEKIRTIIADLQKEGGEKQLEQARKFQEQLTALEVKEAKKRFDELAKLREKYQTNQEKMQTVQTNLFADKDALALLEEQKALGNEVNKEQEELLRLRIQAGEDALLQLRSEALQLTDFWQKLFSDLNDISVNSLLDLSRMTNEIIANKKEIKGDKGELKGYSSSYTGADGIKREVTLTKQQYQQLLKQDNQVADEIQKKNPFRALYEAMLKGKKESETQLDYYTRLESILGDVSNAAFGAAEDMLDIFGANDEAKEMLNNIKGIADGAVNLGMGAARIASGDIIGGSLSAISGVASIVTSITKIHDNKREKEIKRQIKLVENLQRSYGKLEQAIEDAYSIDTYKSSNENAIANLKEQNEALEKSIAAERDKKKTDDDRIKEWQQQIEDNLETIEELNEEFINSLGGFGSEANVKSAAQEFADAWLEAYLETGDGLNALNEKWDEYIQNVIAKQLMLRGAEKYLKPVMDMLDGMLEDAVFSPTEAKDLQDKIDQIMPQLNEFWKAIAGSFDLDSMQPSGDTMSELQRGITSLSESTGQALESLFNSVRYFTADSNAVLHNIYNSIAMPTAENPFLAEMKVQSEQLRLLYGLFNGIVKNVSGSGRALSVRIV